MLKSKLIPLLKGSFPLIHINSREYDRVIDDIKLTVETLEDLQYTFAIYDSIKGLDGRSGDLEDTLTEISNYANYILIIKNINLYWEDYKKVKTIDALYNFYKAGLEKGLHLINISNTVIIPELSDYFVVIDYPLPSEEIIYSIASSFIAEYKLKVSEDTKQKISSLCKGMSKAEIENSLVMSYLADKNESIDINVLKAEKAKIVRKSGLLEWIEDLPSINDIGGLDNLKEWFKTIAKVMKDPKKAKEYGLNIPKGCLLCGIPGTGKSLSAKAIASIFELPLFRLDIGRLFGSLVGETEKNTREVLKVIDAMSPCVIMIDEIEKALSGIQSSGHSDSGITARVIGSFLYYLQEKKTSSYFVCTANNIELLPPELLRKGRFDEIWYVGLPSAQERLSIFNIHFKKSGRDIKDYDYKKLVNLTSQFTGAEIEAVVSQTLYKTFAEDREPTTEDFLAVIKETTPFAVIKSDYINRLNQWATANKVRMANAVEKETAKRKIVA